MGPWLVLCLTQAFAGTSSTSTASDSEARVAAEHPSRIRYELGGQIFFRARAQNTSDTWSASYEITRARLSAKFRFDDLLALVLEPEFAGFVCTASGSACDGVELSDIFLDLSPSKRLGLRLGQAKSPYGIVETTSEWRLPVLHRGLVSRLVTTRLGFGGRRLGIRARIRPDLALKPSAELGVYNDPAVGDALDGALRLGIKVSKGARLEWSGYARAHATVAEKYGFASALGLAFDRSPVFAVVELGIVRARRLTISGPSPDDTTAVSGRTLAAVAVPISQQIELAPYVALDVFDPSLSTRDDLGGSVRGGAGVFVAGSLRFSVEVERRGGQLAFVSPNETLLTFLAGGSLEQGELE
ncbi:MAG: hypothetical protein HY791_26045 [Deltaproteobacteria bacterium]|nr:hypothetical protein [Deltaproteobacteria bacterium]